MTGRPGVRAQGLESTAIVHAPRAAARLTRRRLRTIDHVGTLSMPDPSSKHLSRFSLLSGIGHAMSILLSATAMAWLARLLVVRDPVQGAWALQVMMALAAFLAGTWGAVHRYRTWTLPARNLLTLLARVRDGEEPIERLAEIDGGPRALVPPIQELLRELRGQRAALVELEMEMRQKVA